VQIYLRRLPETSNQEFPIPYNNLYLKTGVIFDSFGGVFLDDFNIDEKNWDRSFWGICGFSYSDLIVESTGSINERIITGQKTTIAKLTTNAEVVNSDTGLWNGVVTGVANQKIQEYFPTIINPNGSSGHFPSQLALYTPTEVLKESAKIEATNLPTKTIRPYFTIRSDLLSNDKYSGGIANKSNLPVIGVLQKNQQYGDFFYGEGGIEFTNTYPRTITSITTHICDPSGESANISPNSAVMYSIKKINNANMNVAEQVLQNLKSKKK
jgi:hypothetical protein